MNKEFVYINNNEVAISDENGHITTRKAEGNMKNILVEEDKIDSLNNTLNNLNISIKEEKTLINIINKWYKVMGAVTLGVAIVAPISMGFISGLCLTGAWAAIASFSCVTGMFTQREAVKRINGYNKEIKRAINLKKESEENLNRYQSMDEEYSVSNALVGDVVQTNALEELEHQDNKLRRAFKAGYKNTPKVLVKTKKDIKK